MYVLAGAIAVGLIIAVIFRFKHELVLSLFSPELACATSVRLNRLNLYFLLVFSLTVLVGLRFMGALLAGALIIIPATTGRRLAGDVSHFLWNSCLVSVFAVRSGFVMTAVWPRLSFGPVVVIIAALPFGLSLLKRLA